MTEKVSREPLPGTVEQVLTQSEQTFTLSPLPL